MRRKLPLLVTAGILIVLACLVFPERRSAIPSDFQFQSHFSRNEAEMFYAKTWRDLRQSYWKEIRLNLWNRRFKYGWNKWKNGPGHIEGVLTNSNADVMACVKFKNGETFWITVSYGHDQGLAKRR